MVIRGFSEKEGKLYELKKKGLFLKSKAVEEKEKSVEDVSNLSANLNDEVKAIAQYQEHKEQTNDPGTAAVLDHIQEEEIEHAEELKEAIENNEENGETLVEEQDDYAGPRIGKPYGMQHRRQGRGAGYIVNNPPKMFSGEMDTLDDNSEIEEEEKNIRERLRYGNTIPGRVLADENYQTGGNPRKVSLNTSVANRTQYAAPIKINETIECETPGNLIRSKEKGRGLAHGRGRGPIGIPIGEKIEENNSCDTPGERIRSEGRGRGLARGVGRGPLNKIKSMSTTSGKGGEATPIGMGSYPKTKKKNKKRK